MTDEQIIKAVEVCREPDTCKDCPYHKLYTARCIIMLMKDVFDLINRQKAEIERLEKKNEKYINRIEKDIVLPTIFGEQARTEANLQKHICRIGQKGQTGKYLGS